MAATSKTRQEGTEAPGAVKATADDIVAPPPTKDRALSLEFDLSFPMTQIRISDETEDSASQTERNTRIDLGTRYHFIRFEDSEQHEYFSFYIGGAASALFAGDLDIGASLRLGIEYSPPRTPLGFEVGFRYDTLGDQIRFGEEAKVTVGIKIPVLR